MKHIVEIPDYKEYIAFRIEQKQKDTRQRDVYRGDLMNETFLQSEYDRCTYYESKGHDHIEIDMLGVFPGSFFSWYAETKIRS